MAAAAHWDRERALKAIEFANAHGLPVALWLYQHPPTVPDRPSDFHPMVVSFASWPTSVEVHACHGHTPATIHVSGASWDTIRDAVFLNGDGRLFRWYCTSPITTSRTAVYDMMPAVRDMDTRLMLKSHHCEILKELTPLPYVLLGLVAEYAMVSDELGTDAVFYLF